MGFLKSFAVWAAFTCFPAVVLLLRARRLRGEDILFFLPLLLIALVGSALLWLPNLRMNSVRKTLILGSVLGLALPILGGPIWMIIVPGFEAGAAIFVGSLMVSVPSAVGGGIAAWIRSRSK